MGIFQFAPGSQILAITEDVHSITLNVRRLFGFRSRQSYLFFETKEGTAEMEQDFLDASGQLIFYSQQSLGMINISINDDDLPEPDEIFYVYLKDAMELDGSTPTAYIGSGPRVDQQNAVANITIIDNDSDPLNVTESNGLLSMSPAQMTVKEDFSGAPGEKQKIVLRVQRTEGLKGEVSASIQVCAANSIITQSCLTEQHNTWAEEGNDFELETLSVTLAEGQRQAEVTITILDDPEPEGQEVFIIYLHEPQGGVELISAIHPSGLTTFSKIIILGKL